MSAPKCPRCGKRAGEPLRREEPSLRPDSDVAHVYVEVGWRCWSCDHTWGFEHITEDSHLAADMEGPLCDFCSDSEPSRTFHSRAFEPAPGQYVTADWLACWRCAQLVEAGDRDGLLERALRTFKKHHPNLPFPPEELARESVQRLHAGFWEGLKQEEST